MPRTQRHEFRPDLCVDHKRAKRLSKVETSLLISPWYAATISRDTRRVKAWAKRLGVSPDTAAWTESASYVVVAFSDQFMKGYTCTALKQAVAVALLERAVEIHLQDWTVEFRK